MLILRGQANRMSAPPLGSVPRLTRACVSLACALAVTPARDAAARLCAAGARSRACRPHYARRYKAPGKSSESRCLAGKAGTRAV